MTNQIQGEILFKGIDSAAGPPAEWVYTPWMPVHGDLATFGIEILQITSAITITWNVETRTVEDPATLNDLYDANQTGGSPSAVGVYIAALPDHDAEELVRYKIATGATADVTEWAVVRALQPSWQTDRV